MRYYRTKKQWIKTDPNIRQWKTEERCPGNSDEGDSQLVRITGIGRNYRLGMQLGDTRLKLIQLITVSKT